MNVRAREGSYVHGRDPEQAHVFAVTVSGPARPAWLAKALNAHPEILCFSNWSSAWKEFDPPIEFEEVAYAFLLICATNQAYAAVGDVQGFPKAAIPVVAEVFSRSGQRFGGAGFSSAVVVADPLRAASAHAGGPVEAGNLLNEIVDDVQLGAVYRLEDLEQNAEALAEFVHFISGERVSVDEPWLDTAFALAAEEAPPAAGVEALQLKELEGVLSDDARSCYEALGYQFDLVPQGGR